jgi:hypothetical protein
MIDAAIYGVDTPLNPNRTLKNFLLTNEDSIYTLQRQPSYRQTYCGKELTFLPDFDGSISGLGIPITSYKPLLDVRLRKRAADTVEETSKRLKA